MVSEGITECNLDRLQRIADLYFCSSWGDDALFALGELALQSGDHQAARNAWSQLGSYPALGFPQAEVQARLVLVSVREGDWERAERELLELRESYPTATGRLVGEEGVLVDLIAGLLKQARQSPVLRATPGWQTFGANFRRTNAQSTPTQKASYELAWSQPLDNSQLLVFPIVVNDLVIYQGQLVGSCLRLSDGKQVFHAREKCFGRQFWSQGGWGNHGIR